jgi:hypothetical protein
MNDTCNAARAVATKLKECLEVHAKEYFGTTDDEWEGLPKPVVREARTYCVDLLCWAHLRNLFIGEGAKQEKAYLKTQLKVLYCTALYRILLYSALLYCTPTHTTVYTDDISSWLRMHEQKNGSLGSIYKDALFSTTNTISKPK